MSNWLEEDSIVEKIKDTLESHKKFVIICEEEKNKFQDKYNTSNKYEACNHQHYRGMIAGISVAIKDLEEILSEIKEIQLEEIKQFDEAEDDYRINRADSCISG